MSGAVDLKLLRDLENSATPKMADVFAFEAAAPEELRQNWRRRPRKKLNMKAAGEKRDRKDSGCCSDDGMSPNDHSTPDQGN